MTDRYCPECYRRDFDEVDSSGKIEGKHVYRVYRRCSCGHRWTVTIDARTGIECAEGEDDE